MGFLQSLAIPEERLAENLGQKLVANRKEEKYIKNNQPIPSKIIFKQGSGSRDLSKSISFARPCRFH